ncbi:MAG: hypothetical protein ABI467_05270 [Kofleriaceae bacterium]
MAVDRVAARRVAWALLIWLANACGPTVKTGAAPPAEPVSVTRMAVTRPHGGGGREVLLGEMCPQGAGGRPAIAPLVMRGVGWTDNATDLTAAVERGSVPRFVVFASDGKLAGAFDTMGVVDVGLPQQVAAGAYAGASPCTVAAPAIAKPQPGTLAMRAPDPKCSAAMHDCGIAVGEVVHPDEPPETPTFVTGGACVSGDMLAVDIDGDGRIESFPLSGILDGTRAPAAEWSAAPTATAACTPTFTVYGIKLLAESETGKPVDPKSIVTADLLGVVDLDGDGRRELILALEFATVRSIVVFTATAQAQRLELAGEATSFPR